MKQNSKSYVKGITLGVICYFFFSLMDTSIKYTLTFTPIYLPLLYFYTNVILGSILLIIILIRGRKYFFVKSQFGLLLRVILGSVSLNLAFFSVSKTTLDTYYSIIFTTPIIASIMASIFLKERFTKDKVMALLFGFIGILVITAPWASAHHTKTSIMFVIMFVAFLSASIAVTTNKFLKNTSPLSIIFYQCVTASVIGFFTLKLTNHGFALPDYSLLINIFVIVLVVFLAYLFFNLALQNTPVQIVVPTEFTQIIWGILFGFLLFHNKPTINNIIGALIIIGINLYISLKYIYKNKKVIS